MLPSNWIPPVRRNTPNSARRTGRRAKNTCVKYAIRGWKNGTPNYHTISSPFGLRLSPTTGASIYHSGIDIPAPENTAIYSASSGIVTYLDFNGANGYTIMIQNSNTLLIYSHISPNFIVQLGETIHQNQKIGSVGSKYIPNIPNNPYTDSFR